MKNWSEVEKGIVAKYLRGNQTLANNIVNEVNSKLYSKEMLKIFIGGQYPTNENININHETNTLDEDAMIMHQVRVSMALLLTEMVLPYTNQMVMTEDLSKFIFQYITFNWSMIMNTYHQKLLKHIGIISKFLK